MPAPLGASNQPQAGAAGAAAAGLSLQSTPGGTRFWRIDADATVNLTRSHENASPLAELRGTGTTFLRLAGSPQTGSDVRHWHHAHLAVGDRPRQLALALAEFGRIEKTLHTLNYIDDENGRRATLLQLNRGEGRHSLARDIFYGKRGELRQRYREGQEDQLGALGLAINIIVL